MSIILENAARKAAALAPGGGGAAAPMGRRSAAGNDAHGGAADASPGAAKHGRRAVLDLTPVGARAANVNVLVVHHPPAAAEPVAPLPAPRHALASLGLQRELRHAASGSGGQQWGPAAAAAAAAGSPGGRGSFSGTYSTVGAPASTTSTALDSQHSVSMPQWPALPSDAAGPSPNGAPGTALGGLPAAPSHAPPEPPAGAARGERSTVRFAGDALDGDAGLPVASSSSVSAGGATQLRSKLSSSLVVDPRDALDLFAADVPPPVRSSVSGTGGLLVAGGASGSGKPGGLLVSAGSSRRQPQHPMSMPGLCDVLLQAHAAQQTHPQLASAPVVLAHQASLGGGGGGQPPSFVSRRSFNGASAAAAALGGGGAAPPAPPPLLAASVAAPMAAILQQAGAARSEFRRLLHAKDANGDAAAHHARAVSGRRQTYGGTGEHAGAPSMAAAGGGAAQQGGAGGPSSSALRALEALRSQSDVQIEPTGKGEGVAAARVPSSRPGLRTLPSARSRNAAAAQRQHLLQQPTGPATK